MCINLIIIFICVYPFGVLLCLNILIAVLAKHMFVILFLVLDGEDLFEEVEAHVPYIEIPPLSSTDEEDSDDEYQVKKASRLKFSKNPIRVCFLRLACTGIVSQFYTLKLILFYYTTFI